MGFVKMSRSRDAWGPSPRRAQILVPVLVLGICAALLPLGQPAHAYSLGTQIGQYLLIGMGPVNDLGPQPGIGQAVNMNNFELGANKANVPAPSFFGPDLRGNVPNIPSSAKPVATGITTDGNVAITSPGGVFNLQDVGVYADRGIRCAQSIANCDVGTQNSFFNDPNQFPSTFTPSGTGAPTNNNVDGTGVIVNPGDAVQTTRIDKPTSSGVFGSFDFSSLLAELLAAQAAVPLLGTTATLNVSGTGGKITKDVEGIGFTGGITGSDVQITDGRGGSSGDRSAESGLTTVNLSSGLNVIDIVTGGGKDFLIQESSLVIDGPADAFAIFRIPSDAKMNISNANVLVGDGGIGLNNVLFFSNRTDKGTHFGFSNTVLNGISFWTLNTTGGSIDINNAQGCTQLIADKIVLNDVRFMRCGFGDTTQRVPAPGGVLLLGVGLAGLGALRWRARHRGAS